MALVGASNENCPVFASTALEPGYGKLLNYSSLQSKEKSHNVLLIRESNQKGCITIDRCFYNAQTKATTCTSHRFALEKDERGQFVWKSANDLNNLAMIVKRKGMQHLEGSNFSQYASSLHELLSRFGNLLRFPPVFLFPEEAERATVNYNNVDQLAELFNQVDLKEPEPMMGDENLNLNTNDERRKRHKQELNPVEPNEDVKKENEPAAPIPLLALWQEQARRRQEAQEEAHETISKKYGQNR